ASPGPVIEPGPSAATLPPATATDAPAWDQLAPDTDNPIGRADTDRSSRRRRRHAKATAAPNTAESASPARAARASSRHSRLPLIVAASLGAVVGIAALVWALLPDHKSPPPDQQGEPARVTFVVDPSGATEGARRFLAQAVRDIPRHGQARIVVKGTLIE